jgi:iron(II)-dependent oxidoreductase
MSRFLIDSMEDARRRTLTLVDGLDSAQLMGPRLPMVNPLRWEIGHTAYFYEYWILRQHLGLEPFLASVDSLYDSIAIAHNARWDLPLPSLDDTQVYMRAVQERVRRHVEQDGPDRRRDYLLAYAIFHEDMHTEAFTYMRQTLAYPTPAIGAVPGKLMQGRLGGDAQIPGGTFMLGATPQDGFVFDNEKWAHAVEVQPFAIARAAVSNAEYAAFVDAGGYRDAIHICWHEARAYCRWAGRRLPSELEWEVAAAGQVDAHGGLSIDKRRYPWGDAKPAPHLANLEGYALGTIAVGALPESDSAFGCRQMIGNAWEWTEDTFGPYPGFTPDMYQDYSQPLFGKTKVLRGGAWTTRGRMIRNTWRTYYGAERNDVFAGFRTCAL